MKPASQARKRAEGAEPETTGASAALLAEMAAIAAEPQLEPALARMAQLIAGLTGARAAALFVVDGVQLAASGWHPAATDCPAELRVAIESAAREAAEPGAHDTARVREAGGTLVRTLPLAAAGKLHGVACLAGGRGRAGAKRLEDPRVEAALALFLPRLAWLREAAQAASARAQYERWFKTLDEQLRVLDRERQKFAAIVQQSDTAVFVADTSATVRWNNSVLAAQRPGATEESGWTGLACRAVCEHFSDRDQAPACEDCAVQRALENAAVTHGELRRIEENGVRNRYLTALPIKGPDGRPQEVMVMIQDLSDLAVLRRSESRYRMLFERSGKAIVMVDPATRKIVLANPTADRLADSPRDGLTGLPLEELHTPEEWPRIEPLFSEEFAAKGLAGLECRVRTRKGGTRIATVSSTRTDLDGREVLMLEYVDMTERLHVEAALRAAEERLRALVVNAPVVLFALDANGVFTLSEGRALESLGLTPGQVVGRSAYELYHAVPAVIENIKRGLAGEEFTAVVDVGKFAFETRYTPVRDAEGRVTGLIGVATDVTERRRLEDQLRQSQKMEAIGRLAGGVAHDFNNLLAAIQGHAELMLGQLPQGLPLHRSATEVHKAAARGALLTRQLLTFSRKEVVAPGAFDLNLVVAEMENMLRRLIGEQITLTITLADTPLRARCDRGQLEQVLLNLAVNARDAMPEGGPIAIAVSGADVAEDECAAHPGARPGPHVRVTVRDAGCGMDEHTRAHLFEPFFTTKSAGKGTGLGLSTVYGIVQRAGGHIRVQSAPGQGSTFTVYLPRVEAPAAVEEPERTVGDTVHGAETILVVEDEDAVRSMVREALEARGYRVLVARNGVEALDLAGRYGDYIDLLISDVIMPQMNGAELAQRLARLRPGLRVLFVSGYTDDAVIRLGVLEKRTAFLQKPFSLDLLARTVREVLDQGPAPSSVDSAASHS
jgi:PAS domain S-box-containing protein